MVFDCFWPLPGLIREVHLGQIIYLLPLSLKVTHTRVLGLTEMGLRRKYKADLIDLNHYLSLKLQIYDQY